MGRMNSAQLSLSRSRRASDRTDQLSTVHDSMNEAETHAELIDPAPRTAGCGVVEGRRIRPEVIAPGRLVGNGRRAPAEYADYIYRGHKLAVIEAKKRDADAFGGVGQANKYAQKLETRFVYSSNGDDIYQIALWLSALVQVLSLELAVLVAVLVAVS